MTTLKRLAAAGMVVAIILGFLLLPCSERTWDTPAGYVSGWKLRQIGLALHSYHDLYKKLPPAVILNKDGLPLYSWRVALLPFLEQGSLYHRFKLDEPWDSPHNKALLEPTPGCYGMWSPNDPPGTTRYQVIVGPGSAFERDGLSLLKDFPKPSGTILVIESGEPVPWSKPADLVYDPKGPLPKLGAGYAVPSHFLCYEVGRERGFNACVADGSSRWFPETTDEKVLRALITRNGGNRIN